LRHASGTVSPTGENTHASDDDTLRLYHACVSLRNYG